VGEYYEKQIFLEVDPERVMIFTLVSSVKKNWYVRILKTTGKGYFQKSLRTEAESVARDKATRLYLDLWSTETKGIEFIDKRFSPLFIKFMEDWGFSSARLTRIQTTFTRYFEPFFGGMRLSQIDGTTYREYLTWRCAYWKTAREDGTLEQERLEGKGTYNTVDLPSHTTLKSERQIMKQFLYWCVDKRWMEYVPPLRVDFSKYNEQALKGTKRRAKALPKKHEEAIERYLRKYCLVDSLHEKNWIRRFGRQRMYYFMYICRHTLIRPSTEATGLKWRDVEFHKSKRFKEEGLQLAIIYVSEAKTGKPRSVVMPYGQVKLILEWRDILTEYGLYRNDGYVFPKHDGGRSQAVQIGRLLSRKLQEKNLHRLSEKYGADAKDDRRKVTMYSIVRHTGITRRIERSKWDVGTVAMMAGTSIFQISTHYFEAFIRQDPDRYAFTYADDGVTPILKDHTKDYINNRVELFERELASVKEQ